jgi:hypothetical protein
MVFARVSEMRIFLSRCNARACFLVEDKRTNGGDTRSTFDDELDNLAFLDGLRTIKQYVRSMLLSSTSNRFLILSLFNFESTKTTASFVPKFFMLTYEVATRIS